jgi:PAS domain S-box-containing protein
MAGASATDPVLVEGARIAAIERSGVLDIASSEELDRITRMVARVFNIPVCMATVVDVEKIWVKSAVGFESTCMDREGGLCEAVVLGGKMMTSADAGLDPVARLHSLVDTDGGIVFYAAAPVRTNDGYIVGSLCILGVERREFTDGEKETLQDFAHSISNIIESHRAERERDANRRLLEIISENPYLMIIETDQNGLLTYVNAASCTIFGYKSEEMIGNHFLKFAPPATQQHTVDSFKRLVEGNYQHGSTTFIHADGSKLVLEFAASPLKSTHGEFRTVSVLIDITEHIDAVAEKEAAQVKYRQLFQASRDGMAFLDLEGNIIEANSSFCEISGYEKKELKHRTFQSMRPSTLSKSEMDDNYKQITEIGFMPEYEGEMLRKDGSLVAISACAWLLKDINDGPSIVLTRIRDFTEQRKVESAKSELKAELEVQVATRTHEIEETLARLRRAERLASIGTLASGLAHQINNPIGAILNAAEYALLCEDDEDGSEVWKAALLNAVAQSRRCGRIVRSMLQYSRGAPTERWAENVDVVLQGALNAIQSYAKRKGASIEVTHPAAALWVVMNPIEMEQALVNVLNNAIESNPLGATIKVMVEARGDQACIVIEDDGIGISPDDRNRVFDPFYSTREQDGGTGLGLSVSVGIVNEFGGTMTVSGKQGTGTVVTILMRTAASGIPST